MAKCKSVSKTINVHDLAQLPGPGLEADPTITVTNKHHLHVTELDASQQSFKLEVTEPDVLGLAIFDDTHANEFMRRVILACNLILKRAVFSTSSIDSSHAGVVLEYMPGTSKAEKTPTGLKVVNTETFSIRDSVLLKVGFINELDEKKVIDVLQKIHVVYDSGNNSSSKILDMQKALDAYQGGMQSTGALHAFKGIYEAMELAANSDGPRSEGPAFEKKVQRLINDSTAQIGVFRNFNNSSKHSGKTKHTADYERGKANINKYIRDLRPITTAVVLCRL